MTVIGAQYKLRYQVPVIKNDKIQEMAADH